LNGWAYVLLDLLQFLLSPEAALPDPLDLVALLGLLSLELEVVGLMKDFHAIVFLLSVGCGGQVEVIVVNVGTVVVVSDSVVGPFHWTSWMVRSISSFLNSR
jgi:hypothetical protein